MRRSTLLRALQGVFAIPGLGVGVGLQRAAVAPLRCALGTKQVSTPSSWHRSSRHLGPLYDAAGGWRWVRRIVARVEVGNAGADTRTVYAISGCVTPLARIGYRPLAMTQRIMDPPPASY
jgi:hypothetical protein